MVKREPSRLFSRRLMLLLGSLLCLYAMPHFMLAGGGFPVSAGFALVLIGSSRPAFAKRRLLKYTAYLAISVGTYYFLFQNQPWEFLFGWLPDGIQQLNVWPVSICSIMMAFAGWLLLSGRAARRRYLLVTLLIQLPLSVGFHVDGVHSAFETLAKVLRYSGEYVDAEQAWQFLWLLNYYLPVYRWSRSPQDSGGRGDPSALGGEALAVGGE